MSRSLLLAGSLALLAAAPLAAGPDRWTALGPEGGSIHKLSASPAAPGTVWAISSLGRIFKTTDGAATWTPVTSLLGRGVFDLLPDPSNASILYAWTYVDGVLKSVDGGATWTPVNQGLAYPIYDLAIAPSRPATLYATGKDHLFKSTDGGAHWAAAGEPLWPLAVSPADPDTLLGLSDYVLLRTRDGGTHWEEVASLSSSLPKNVFFDPHAPNRLYADTVRQGVVRSDDGGETWIPLSTPGTSFFLRDLEADPLSPGALWLIGRAYGENTEGLWLSDDRGESWTLVFGDYPVSDIAFDQVGGILAGVPRTGVLSSKDRGLHWTPSHRGLIAVAVNQVGVASDGTVWAGGIGESGAFLSGLNNSLFRSRDQGATWDDLIPGGSLHVTGIALAPGDPKTVHVSIYGGVYSTADGGETWSFSSRGMRWGEILWGIALAPSQPEILYTGGIGSPACNTHVCGQFRLFKSTDGGATWSRARKGLPRRLSLGSFVVHPTRPDTVWAGGAGLYKSTDGGQSWLPVGQGLRGAVLDLEIDPLAPDTLYASLFLEQGRKVFKSVNGGRTWRHATDGLPPDTRVSDLAVDPARPATLYAAAGSRVFVTEDGGSRWRPLGDALAGFSILAVAVDPSNPRTVYAGTDAGLFVLTRTDR